MSENIFFYSTKKFYIGLIALVIGAAVYIFFRPAEQAIFSSWLSNDLNIFKNHPPFWVYNISALLHTFSMILISSSFTRNTRLNNILITLTWTLINTFFELLQHTFFKDYIYNELSIKSLGYALDAYILNGTYDKYDIIFSVAGSILAFTANELINRGKR